MALWEGSNIILGEVEGVHMVPGIYSMRYSGWKEEGVQVFVDRVPFWA